MVLEVLLATLGFFFGALLLINALMKEHDRRVRERA